MTTAQPTDTSDIKSSTPTNNIDKEQIHVKILNQQQTLFEGNADAVTAISPTGPFDILPQHIQIITLIKNELIVRTPDENKNFSIKTGVLRCKGNQVDVYIIS